MNLINIIQSGLRLKKIANKTGMVATFAAVLFGALLIWLLYSDYTLNQVLCNRNKNTGLWTFRDLLSNSSIYGWTLALLLTIITLFIKNKHTPQWTSYFVYTGLLSLILLLDDYYMIPSIYAHPWICYLIYFLLGLVFILRHYREIVEANPFAFLGTAGLLVLSVITNLMHAYFPWSASIPLVIIAGSKFMATVLWLYFIFNSFTAALAADEKKSDVSSGFFQ